MSERERFLAALASAVASGEEVVMATVVGADGSVYRRIGGRMLIAGDGSQVGAVSGGCLEADLVHHATTMRGSDRAALFTYDTRDVGDATWGTGVGCRGIIDVLLEPVGPERLPEVEAFYRRVLLPDRRTVVATLIRSPDGDEAPGARMLVTSEGAEPVQVTRPDGWEAVLPDARRALEEGRSLVRTYPRPTGEWQVAIEVVEPPVRLLVIGGGDDSAPVTTIARELGWRVEVVDHRPAFAAPERFPAAERVVCSEPEHLAQHMDLAERTAAVVMTHSYPRDQIYLRLLIEAGLSYVGMLGPRARTQQLIGDLAAEGFQISPEQLERVHGPAGLDVGGDSPESIALSIVAEVHTVVSRRAGGFLRDRRAPLHE